ncbi:hypothetical protein [Roseofilum casamattae]|uniref:Uncharacterized protein n=1 Tax=Roseofilum casamattae BLCC-M143 TaxID=3022442 RepID=A0ABT7BUQ7_9CYAN|nr:hypothetical protein [Roseofilum casamattae]MDJ1182254.1 hypothetical protein [Roseofilum casamattae BLCC-M143]
MTQTVKHPTAAVVPLTEAINVRTDISLENLPALRAGFALCPSNPRWNIFKFRAWRLGRQWRYALQSGEMAVCPTRRLLVVASDLQDRECDREDEGVPRRYSPKNSIVSIKKRIRSSVNF